MANYYMTAQSKQSNMPSTFIINGEVSLFCNEPKQQHIADKMAATMSWQNVPYEDSLRQSGLPEWFQIRYKSGLGYLISSCFQDEDEAGRKMGFQFLAETDDFEETISLLKLAAEKSGRKLDEKEIEILSKEHNLYYQHLKEKRKKSERKNMKYALGGPLIVGGITLIVGGITLIAKSCNEENEQNNNKSESDAVVIDTTKVNNKK